MHRVISRRYSMGPLFNHQSQLPKLIVPALDETCERYLSSVKPLATEAEYKSTLKNVADFTKPGGFGEVLQKRLIERSNSSEKGWLIEWWNNYAYMAYREPVVLNVNYFYVFVDDPFRRDPVARAASIVTGALAFRDLVVTYII